MRAKSMLLLVIALGCGVVASVAVSQVVLDQKNRGETQTAPVLVVAKEISAATKIGPDSFRIEQWPVDRIPLGAISDPKLMENKFTKQRFYLGEPIIEAKLSGKGRDFTVPEGYRTFDIAVKDETGGGGYIGPGDHVDVYGYFEKGARVKAAKSVKVMENLEVVMIDGVAVIDAEATKQKKSSTIQLLVKDSQYVVLDTASNLGKLRLALRPPAKVAAIGESTDDGERFISWLKESEANPVEKAVPDSIVSETPVQPEKAEQHEMVIVSPSKSTLYRWTKNQMMPQKVELGQPDEPSSSSGFQNPSQSDSKSTDNPFPPSQTPVPNASSTSSLMQASQTSGAAKAANAAMPYQAWDSSTPSWQPGGFKATYPSRQ